MESLTLSKRQISLLLFIDLKKEGFDILEHSILFDKLENYEIKGLALKWKYSYPSSRNLKQSVSINGKNSLTSFQTCKLKRILYKRILYKRILYKRI